MSLGASPPHEPAHCESCSPLAETPHKMIMTRPSQDIFVVSRPSQGTLAQVSWKAVRLWALQVARL